MNDDDLIRRGDAIIAVRDILKKYTPLAVRAMYAVRGIRNIPSVQSERKPGHWKLLDNDPDQNAYECSACGNAFVLIDGTPKENNYNYCPNCGARMAKREKTENWEMIDNTHTEMLTWEPEGE